MSPQPAFCPALALPARPLSRPTASCAPRARRLAHAVAPRMTCAPLVPRPSDPCPDELPANTPDPVALADLEARAGDPAAALSLYAAHVADAAPDPRVWLRYANLSRRVRGCAHAAAVLRQALLVLPSHPRIWHMLAACVLRADGRQSARAVYRTALSRVPESAALLCASGALEADDARYAHAEMLFRKAVVCDRADGHIYMKWASMERRRRNLTAARRVFEEGVKHVPRNKSAPLYTAYAQLEASHRNLHRARFLYLRAAEADPKDVLVWQAWACLEDRSGNTARARELFERGVVVDPANSSCWQAWGVLEDRAGDRDAARCLLERGTRADPADSACWQAWASLEARAGNVVEARRLFDEAATRVGDRRAAVLFLSWARLEQDARHHDVARQLYRRGLERSNESRQDLVRLLTSWAGLERRLGATDTARDLYNQALQKNPRDHKTLHALSQLETELGHHDAARQLLRRCVKVSPRDLMGVRALAALEWRHFAHDGGVDRARDLFNRAAKQHRDDPALIRIWAEFERDQGQHELSHRLLALAQRRR